MLKTLESTKSITQPREGGVMVSGDNTAGQDSRCKLGKTDVDDVEVEDNEVGKKD